MKEVVNDVCERCSDSIFVVKVKIRWIWIMDYADKHNGTLCDYYQREVKTQQKEEWIGRCLQVLRDLILQLIVVRREDN